MSEVRFQFSVLRSEKGKSLLPIRRERKQATLEGGEQVLQDCSLFIYFLQIDKPVQIWEVPIDPAIYILSLPYPASTGP
jgi:hypothetical protein